ncbi:hypothetical protein AVEN_224292-1 [Araneus ventricosus]|uniref:Uncharacterized protein n=1 Tax=Araneus ventricosus TaxID=182803 RepID=A0A4Y2TY37_ARAVE|nr:hypothetical protein AVEN_224292-1 [Araneus ventricosus]
MNPSKERRRSELQITLPRRNPFTAQKIRREKATLSNFYLDGLWAAMPSSSAGTEPTERERDALFNLFSPLIPTQSGNLIGCLWVLVSDCVASTETHLVDRLFAFS